MDIGLVERLKHSKQERLQRALSRALSIQALSIHASLAASVLPVLATAMPATGFDTAAGCNPRFKDDGLVRISQIIGRSTDGSGGLTGTKAYWPLRHETTARHELIQTGEEFEVIRCLPPGRWTTVGRGVVLGLRGAYVESALEAGPNDALVDGAAVDANASLRAAARVFNEYEAPMVSDVVVAATRRIAFKQSISPRLEFSNDELFDRTTESSARSNSVRREYRLSSTGAQSLEHALGAFHALNGRILVEGFSRHQGSRAELREESDLRARVVKQFIVRQLGLAEAQVVAFGLGSDELVGGLQPVPSYPEKAPLDGVRIRMLSEK